VRLFDLSTDPAIPHLLAMLRDLTQAESAGSTLRAFFDRYGKIRPVDYFIGVVPDRATPGAYRILYAIPVTKEGVQLTGDIPRDLSPAALQRLPVLQGGFISEMIAEPLPKLALDLSLKDDPHIGPIVGHLPTCMVLPIYEGNTVAEWSFGFSHKADGFTTRDVAQAQLTANLLGVTSRKLDAVATVKTLNNRLRDQLDQLARVQQSLLPSRTPDIPGLEIATSYLTSNESGGDYYDFFRLPGERWAILIADVSGHGAAAATVMAMLHAILHCYSPLNPNDDFNPARVMAFANDRLVSAGLEGNFVTAFFAIFDPTTGRFTYTNAGHNPPRLKDGLSGRITPIEGAATVPLGILQDLNATTATIELKPNDTLILYTDGITEAFGPPPSQEQFGIERMDQALTTCSGQPECVVDSIHKALFDHRKAATRDDDQTIVAIRHHGLCMIN
jgi:sigma-B regulation protein RsbU (phosphoserine phosphatase)